MTRKPKRVQKNNTEPKGEPKGQYTKSGMSLSNIIGGHGVRIAPQSLWSIYRLNADVFGCIREWKNGVGSGGHKLMSPQDKEIEPKPEVSSFLEGFFRNSLGFNRFKNKLLRDLGICGNAYFEIVSAVSGKPYGLTRLDPRTIYVVADNHGRILKYYQRATGAKDIEFTPDQIFHIVLDDDPDNELLGMSPLETAVMEARTDISAAESNYYFFENDAVPSILYIPEDGTTQEEQDAALAAINNQFGGSKNRNKAGMLSGIKEIKTISMSQKDMEFILGRKFNTDKVCSVYGVPKFILGYTEAVNYSSGAKLLEKFYRGTIQPLETVIADAINTQLFTKMGIADQAFFEFLPQTFGEELETTRVALEEFKAGALTLRQYKVKTGQLVTAEDEQELLLDKHILHNGASAVLMEDVGVDPVVDPNDEETTQNMIRALESKYSHDEKEDS